MYKKILFIVLVSLTFIEAVELRKEDPSFLENHHGIFDTAVTFSGSVEAHDASVNKDWIAVYKKGTSTAWANVLYWSWLKETTCVNFEPMDGCQYYKFFGKPLPSGTYEVRYFKNNSYTVHKSIDMVVKPHTSYVRGIRVFNGNFSAHKNSQLTIDIDGLSIYLTHGQKDWIAIYKKGTSNEWKNVIKWSWGRNLSQTDKDTWFLDTRDFSDGEYEVRYFLNNSYTTYMKTRFTINNAGVGTTLSVNLVPKDADTINVTVNFFNRGANRTNKDWIALFDATKERTSSNVLAWKYLNQDRNNGSVVLNVSSTQWHGKMLEAVLFENDSYVSLSSVQQNF